MDLTGFLFGNVNEDGELEDESVLDKVSHRRRSRGQRTDQLSYQLVYLVGDSGAAVPYGCGGRVW